MDIKSKNNHKSGALYIFISVVIPALLVMAFYPYIQERAERLVRLHDAAGEEATYEDYYGSSYIYDIYQSGYVLYEDFCKKAAEEPVSEEEIFLPEEYSRMNAEEQERCREALNAVLVYNRDQFRELISSCDYYALDTEHENIETNIADHRDLVAGYVKDQSGEENLKELYDAWICVRYEASGDIVPIGYGKLDANRFLRKVQEYRHVNQLSERYGQDMDGIEMTEPKNMIVFYGLSDVVGYEERNSFRQTYFYYEEAGVWVLFAAMLGIVGLRALAFRRKEKYSLNQSRLFRIPLEIVVWGIVMTVAAYTPLLEMMVSYLTRISSASAISPDAWTWLANFTAWAAVFLLWFWEIGCIVPVFWEGFAAYLRRSSLICRFFPYLKKMWRRHRDWHKKQWKRFMNFVKDVDLTEHMERSIWKVVLINGAVVAILCTMWFGGIVGVVIYSIFLFFFLRRYFTEVRRQYLALLAWVKEMAGGNLNAKMEGDAGIFEPVREEMTQIQSGFKKAVEEEVRSQKMKTELITNVSHDLKTPLTAIITYVDLLKREETTEEERKSYINILEKKSQRLKVLIEDLFEISKATTNNVTLHITDVDIVNLMKQVRFEMEDKLDKSGLDFRWNLPAEKIILALDSQKTYRVFENLIGNILKYAMGGSRVYIDLRKNELDQTVITMKNISATELNFDPREITERFVRGDLSRNTEGSGLGLAIARSFVELQGGRLDIEIDGDLFKAIIVFE